MSNTKKPEIQVVTMLRGFAAMSVFLFHIFCVSGGYINDGFLTNFFSYGKYGVQFFFVISGFVIVYSMLNADYKVSDFFTFLKKRLIRIEPPYLIVVLLTAAFFFIRVKSGMARGEVASPPGITQILLHIGYLIPFTEYKWLSIVFWTLAIEFQFYILVSLCFPALTGNRFIRWGATLILIALYFFIQNAGYFFYWAPIFLLGIYLALYKRGVINSTELFVVSILLGAIIWGKLGLVVFCFSVIPFLAIYFELSFKSRILMFSGKISYSLYLLHTLTAFTVINLGIRFTTNNYHKIFFVSLAFVFTIVCSYLLYYFVERPFKSIASSIKYN